MLRRAARWIWQRPGIQLAVGALFVTIAFPATTAATLGMLVLAAAAGLAIQRVWPRLPPSIRSPGRIATVMVLVAIAAAGLAVFWETLTQSPDWQLGDWGPQHAVLARLMPSLPGLDVPTWNHVVSTGDAPLDLYPAVTYLVTGHVAILLGLENDLPLAFMIVSTVVHISLALLTTAIAMRVASRKVALAVGLLWLVDSGAVSHGGTVGLFHWAILHSALSHVFSLIAMLGVMAALRRPRIGAAVAIWLGTAAATATHPSALLMAAAAMVALLGVALLASDVPPRRALVALGHLAIGVALGAIVWLPASERLLAYGQHFANELYTASQLLQTVMSFAMPITAYSLVVYAGYIGMIVGLFSRRAEVVFISIIAFALLLGLCDLPYLGFGLVPGRETARLGAVRMMLLVRPFMFVAGAYVFSLVGAHARLGWRAAPARQRLVAAALLGVFAGVGVRVLPTYWREESQRAYEQSRVFAPDPEGREELVAWARRQMTQLGPDRWARALFETDTHEQQHLTALTGLPTVHLGALPDLMLRERIEDTTPESLARFDIRWVIAAGQSPTLGDPATETTVGTFHIREVASWDGKFARIERGTGSVVVTRLDDRAVEITLTGTTEPALVALGTGFYPRWRARHESGAAEPVYALPSTRDAALHVVSAWVAPGHTTFTADGPLPSDGDGRLLALAALVLAVAGVVTWARTRWRIRILRRLARIRARTRAIRIPFVRAAVPIVVILLVVRGCTSARGPAPAFRVGTGVRAVATVEAREPGGGWQRCDYVAVRGEYDCEGLATVTDATANVVNDAPPSWPFTTPSVMASAYGPGVEVRIRRTERLAGRYWAGASKPATLSIDGGVRSVQDREVIDFTDGDHAIVWTGDVPFPEALEVTLVSEASVEPPRPFLAPPPPQPPASVRSIR